MEDGPSTILVGNSSVMYHDQKFCRKEGEAKACVLPGL